MLFEVWTEGTCGGIRELPHLRTTAKTAPGDRAIGRGWRTKAIARELGWQGTQCGPWSVGDQLPSDLKQADLWPWWARCLAIRLRVADNQVRIFWGLPSELIRVWIQPPASCQSRICIWCPHPCWHCCCSGNLPSDTWKLRL